MGERGKNRIEKSLQVSERDETKRESERKRKANLCVQDSILMVKVDLT